jgi:hypothetical protein
MDWSKLALAFSQLIFMAFFVTGVVEVVKDAYSRLRTVGNQIANKFRLSPVALTEADLTLSLDTVKLVSFGLGVYFCFVLDYGALSDIVQVGEKLRVNQASWIDYVSTGAILRLGAGGIFDAITALTGRLQAVKDEAAKLTAS